MKTIFIWLKSHPLIPFFSLALGITWGLLIPVLALYQAGFVNQSDLMDVLSLYIARLAIYGPVLAGMIVARWITPKRNPGSARKRWLTFWIVWIVALVVLALGWRQENVSTGLIPLLIISIPIALLPAFVFSSAFSKVASLRDYFSTLVRPRGHFVWYLVALLTFPVVHFLGVVIMNLLEKQPLLFNVHFTPGILTTTLITFASVFFFSGGVNEEGGWRGFAQLRLQVYRSPLVANLLLWVYLVVWHIPNDIVQYREGGYLLIRIGLYPFITILFGWVYNRTGGSILAPALFHASMNSMNTLVDVLPVTNAGNILLVLFAGFAILFDRMWKKLPSDHPAVYQEHLPES